MPPEYIPLAIGAVVLFSLLLAGIGVLQLRKMSSSKKAILDRAQTPGQEVLFGAIASDDKPSSGISGWFADLIGKLGRNVAKDKVASHTELRPKFLKAGIRSEKAPAVYWGVKIILVVLLPMGFLLFRLLAPNIVVSPALGIGIITGLALAGFYLPDLWLTNTIQKRRQTILKGFPDALDLLVVCVEAGMGLDGAINRVAKESKSNNKILSEELHLFTLETRAGMARNQALKNLAMRTDLDEMQNLTTLLIQTDKFGTSVSQALKVYSESLRNQRFQRAEEKAAKIPVKLLFPLILFIFPSLFVAILGPAVISIYQTLLQM